MTSNVNPQFLTSQWIKHIFLYVSAMMSRWNHQYSSSTHILGYSRVMLGTGRGLCLITIPVRVECPHGLTCCRTLSKGSALARSSTHSPVSSLHCSVKSNVSGLTRHLWSFPTCEGEFEHFTGQIVARGSLIHWTNTISPLDPNPAKLQQTYSTTKQTTKMTIISKSTELSTDRPKQTGVFSERVGNYTAFPRVQQN